MIIEDEFFKVETRPAPDAKLYPWTVAVFDKREGRAKLFMYARTESEAIGNAYYFIKDERDIVDKFLQKIKKEM